MRRKNFSEYNCFQKTKKKTIGQPSPDSIIIGSRQHKKSPNQPQNYRPLWLLTTLFPPSLSPKTGLSAPVNALFLLSCILYFHYYKQNVHLTFKKKVCFFILNMSRNICVPTGFQFSEDQLLTGFQFVSQHILLTEQLVHRKEINSEKKILKSNWPSNLTFILLQSWHLSGFTTQRNIKLLIVITELVRNTLTRHVIV